MYGGGGRGIQTAGTREITLFPAPAGFNLRGARAGRPLIATRALSVGLLQLLQLLLQLLQLLQLLHQRAPKRERGGAQIERPQRNCVPHPNSNEGYPTTRPVHGTETPAPERGAARATGHQPRLGPERCVLENVCWWQL